MGSYHNYINVSRPWKIALPNIKERWEKEGGLQITEEEWQDICTFQWKYTKSHAWKEFFWKNVTCFF